MTVRRVADTVDTPVGAVLSFGGLLLAIDSALSTVQLASGAFSASLLASLDPAITFVAAVLWFPVRGGIKWLARRFPE